MLDNPVFAVLYFCGAAYVFYLWLSDLRLQDKPKNAFPGAEYAPKKLILFAAAGGIVLVLLQTLAEIIFGVSGEQSELSYWAIFSICAAAFVEELIFRGYIVVQNKGRAALCASIVFFSIIFALLHPFLWDYTSEGGFVWDISKKQILSTVFIFINSLYFYCLRFNSFNSKRSLIPCFAAHLACNLSVYAIKICQGFIS